MFLIWRGWGIGVPLIVIIVQLLIELIVDKITGSQGFIKTHSWIWFIGLSLSSIIIWFVGNRLDAKPGRVIIDKETQKEYEIKSKHDLFWLPFKWWSIPVLALGFIFVFV